MILYALIFVCLVYSRIASTTWLSYQLRERDEHGETSTIARHGKPVAGLVPAVASCARTSPLCTRSQVEGDGRTE
jgi:hypothetical protein